MLYLQKGYEKIKPVKYQIIYTKMVCKTPKFHLLQHILTQVTTCSQLTSQLTFSSTNVVEY